MKLDLYRYIIFKSLKKIRIGHLELRENEYSYHFGDMSKPPIVVDICRRSFYRVLFFEGTVGAGRSYMQADWKSEQLEELIYIILQNESVFKQIDSWFSKLFHLLNTVRYLIKKNDIATAQKHIQQHYDLSNQFFELFLDRYMMYSSAIFEHPKQALEEASEVKLRIICQKLDLQPTDHVLEIGSGWGGFAVYAAQNYGCKVTTITISQKQYDHVKALIENECLADKVDVIKTDYRNISGKYDKIVSIEMIEAVGFQYYRNYFKVIDQCLNPKGRALIQAITINDADYERAKYEVDFIKKYIFPGGCLPSLGVIHQHIEAYTSLQLMHIEDIGKHYVTTLQHWYYRFNTNITKIKKLGFSETFIRMWEFYFKYCQAGFRKNHINNVQLLWQKK